MIAQYLVATKLQLFSHQERTDSVNNLFKECIKYNSFVRETGPSVRTRFKEHERYIRMWQFNLSGVTDHYYHELSDYSKSTFHSIKIQENFKTIAIYVWRKGTRGYATTSEYLSPLHIYTNANTIQSFSWSRTIFTSFS